MGLGKGLIVVGLLLVAAGMLTLLASKAGLRPFQLPGDIVWRGKNGVVYIPVVTSIILSILLSFILAMMRR